MRNVNRTIRTTRSRRWWCRLRWHSWILTGDRTRYCADCKKKQIFENGLTGPDTGGWVYVD